MKTALVITSLLFLLVGCSPDSDDSSKKVKVTTPAVETPAGQDKMQANGDNVKTDAPVVNDPNQTTPGGAYRIAPKNPDDPKYKADPRLGGGG